MCPFQGRGQMADRFDRVEVVRVVDHGWRIERDARQCGHGSDGLQCVGEHRAALTLHVEFDERLAVLVNAVDRGRVQRVDLKIAEVRHRLTQYFRRSCERQAVQRRSIVPCVQSFAATSDHERLEIDIGDLEAGQQSGVAVPRHAVNEDESDVPLGGPHEVFERILNPSIEHEYVGELIGFQRSERTAPADRVCRDTGNGAAQQAAARAILHGLRVQPRRLQLQQQVAASAGRPVAPQREGNSRTRQVRRVDARPVEHRVGQRRPHDSRPLGRHALEFRAAKRQTVDAHQVGANQVVSLEEDEHILDRLREDAFGQMVKHHQAGVEVLRELLKGRVVDVGHFRERPRQLSTTGRSKLRTIPS